MCKRECRKRLVFVREFGKVADNGDQLVADKLQTLGHDDDIGVVADVARGSSEVDNTLCVRALHAVSVDVGHYVVADELLSLLRDFIVDVVGVSLELVDLSLCYGQTQLHFRLGKRNPESAPGAEFLVG